MITFTLKLKDHPFSYLCKTTGVTLTFNADVIRYKDNTLELSAYNFKPSKYIPQFRLNSLCVKALTHISDLINVNYYKTIQEA